MIWTSDPLALREAQRAFDSSGSSDRGLSFFGLLIAVGALLCTILFGAVAGAECASDYDGPRRVTMEVDGRPGIWFAAPVARCILADLEELPVLRVRITLLEERLELRDSQVDRLRRMIDLASEGERVALEGLEAAMRARREAEEGARVWWRAPVLWLSVGAIITAGLVALTAYSLDAISDPI